MTTPPEDLTLADAANQIRSGTLCSEALVQTCLDRITALSHLNAFISVSAENALRQACHYDRSAKTVHANRPLAGVPIAVKDNIHVAGMPNTAGTLGLKGFYPESTAPIVQKLIDAGAIIIGKTNMHELAFGVSGYNTAFHGSHSLGVRCAYDPERIAGGSSSGNGAAVGARMVPAALGTDTGASVRLPSAINGGVGFRPTVGRYEQTGITPISHTRDTAGPMANCMADIILMDTIITGASHADPIPAEKIRLGLPEWFWSALDHGIETVARTALDRLRDAGVHLIEIDMRELEALNLAVGFPLALHEAKVDLSRYLRDYRPCLSLEDLVWQVSSPDVAAIFNSMILPGLMPSDSGAMVALDAAYDQAIRIERPALIRIYRNAFKKHRLDGLLFPTVPVVAPMSTLEASSPQNFERLVRNVDPGSNAGLPGLTLPAGLDSQGLPVGLEIDGLPGTDSTVLAIGMTLESILGRLTPPAL